MEVELHENINETTVREHHLNALQTFIDEKFYSTLVNKIKAEVKLALNDVLNCDIIHAVKHTHNKNTNDILVESMRNEIMFLRKELTSKDEIIKILIDERLQISKNTLVNSDKKSEVRKSNATEDINVLNATGQNEKNEETKFLRARRNKDTSKRNITLIGDSLIKNIEAHKMKRCMKSNEKIYVKSFPGAKIADMIDHAKPSQRYNPDQIILHTGTNDLRTQKTAEEILNEIITLALEIKKDDNEIIVSGIIARNDEHNEKGKEVNSALKTKCNIYSLGFMDNSNIMINKHLNGSGVHLNYNGTIALANNCLKAINV